MKLTIPSMKNLKRREAFLFAHPDYYPEERLKKELLKIVLQRKEKNLRWDKPQINLPQETPKEISYVVEVKEKSIHLTTLSDKKPSLIDKVKNIFTKG